MESHPTPKQLYRSETDRYVAGVAGGFAEYFGIDSLVIRLLFVILAVGGGSGVIVYALCWLLIPTKSQLKNGKPSWDEEHIREQAHSMAQEVEHIWNQDKDRRWLGYAIVLVGILFLLANFSIVAFGIIGKLWPLILIIIGWNVLVRKRG